MIELTDFGDLQTILDNPVRFRPPVGMDEWPDVTVWGENEWARWLFEHNRYAFLHQWSPEEVIQYLQVDRYKYGLGWRIDGHEQTTWFYLPNPVAIPFHASKVPNILFGGAAGGSKSHSARWDAYRHCFAIPDFMAIIMRRTFVELKDNHLTWATKEAERINDFLGREVVVTVPSEFEIRFKCHGRGHDSKIIFGHCKDEGDEERYLGNAYDAFYPDEMATFTKKQITGIAGRLRTEKRGIMARMAGTSNPAGAQTLWLREYFIDKVADKILKDNPRYKPEKYQFLPAMLWDNPYYMDPDGTYTSYEDRLFEYDRERRLQLLLGDWSALSGQFFPEFGVTRHVKELMIPPGCKIERWIDWGYSPHYGICLWVACLPNGRLFVFYEWKFSNLIASEVSRRIKYYTENDVVQFALTRRISKSVADPSMWSGDGHTGEDYAETFSKNGVSLIKADNERVMGWGRLRHWFRDAPDRLPWLVIHPRCTTVIRTLPTLIRDKSDPDDVDTSGDDHPADALRYGVMARPSPTHFKKDTIFIEGSPAQLMAELAAVTVRQPGQVA